MSEEADEIIRESRETRKEFGEVTKSYLENNSKNIKKIVDMYVGLVGHVSEETDLIKQIAERYKELARSVTFLTWSLIVIFCVVFHELLYRIFISPIQFIQ